MAIFNFGSINIDHVYNVPHFVQPGETLGSSAYDAILGGKGANQSIACAKAGASTFHVGSIHSNDANMLSPMLDASVNMKFVVQQNHTPSGHAIIQVNAQGENAIILFPGANHLLTDEIVKNALSHANEGDWVLLQNETNDIDVIIETAFAHKIPVAFNPAPMTEAVKDLPLEKVSMLIVNEIEAKQLTGTESIDEAQQALLDMSEKTEVLFTLGKKGVRFIKQSKVIHVDAFSVTAVDTTAAGDTFIGFFLAQYAMLQSTIDAHNTNELSNQDAAITQALTRACAASAICVTRHGASPSVPSADEVDEFLRKHRV
ncbi:ribokinase [Ningiella sp. W23]|uniref:ribokinase n=1 Tax=Ningiella sp. W23 TaxID=3023715 RepID=UPI003758137E